MSKAEELLESLTVVEHEHEVVAKEVTFEIDPEDKSISNVTEKILKLNQGEHKSTRFVFNMPRYINGHDMMLCNMVYIPYINAEPDSRTQKFRKGVCTVADMQLVNEDTIKFTWLVTRNSTYYAGGLSFMVIFQCMEGERILYSWNAEPNADVVITAKLDSGETFELEYIDIIEQWKSSVKAEFTKYLELGLDERAIFVKDRVKEELTQYLDGEIERQDDNIGSAVAIMNDTLNAFDDILKTEITNMDSDIDVLKARMDTFTKLEEGSTTGDAELNDIRVGVDGTVYDSAGAAIRGQIEKVQTDSNSIKNIVHPEMEIGSVDHGIYVDMTARARIVKPIKYWNATLYIAQLDGYMFGYTRYDAAGNYDGVDHGWTNMNINRKIKLEGEGSVTMNFTRTDSGVMTEEDLTALSSAIRIEYVDVLHQIDLIKEEMAAGFTVHEDFGLEIGSIAGGTPVDMANRARLTDKIPVDTNVTLYLSKNSTYFYGLSTYDENGVYDGLDRGWVHLVNNTEITFDEPGYFRLNFMRTDNGEITEDDLAVITEFIQIISKEDDSSVVKKVRELDRRTEGMIETIDKVAHHYAMNSINIEYGRRNGASYVFARIPKTTNYGTKMVPKVRLTSPNGIADGVCRSALKYSQDNGDVFTLNAGLFNMTYMIPVGQTIIDGESITNVPMEDDMGSPISDSECYPLCIDANGDLSAPYTRFVDTANMLADGVVCAVTGWGKVIDNFKPCADTVENEIVHAGKYIRQTIGQFQNGDYFVCSVDMSRGSVQNEAGITYEDLAQLFIEKGVKFAYSLDGGGSCETVIGVRQLNPIYEGTVGRPVPTVIAFEESDG